MLSRHEAEDVIYEAIEQHEESNELYVVYWGSSDVRLVWNSPLIKDIYLEFYPDEPNDDFNL